MRKLMGQAGKLLAGTALVGIAAVAWRWNTRAKTALVAVDLPEGFSESGFSHAAFEALLERFVHDGRVDYSAWHADRDALVELDRYLAAVARYSPDNTPERFADDHHRLCYWLHAYNAFVIKAVLERWPIDSVTSVKAPFEIVKGLGFFYTLEFIAGGRRWRLYDLEHQKVLRPSRDPRVHFVLNCGSAGCPALRPRLPADDLDATLERAAREFIADRRHVEVDHQAGRVWLSQIFEWYRRDFIADLARRGLPSAGGLVAYVRQYADDTLRMELDRARPYPIAFRPYDWAINHT
jgi:hypothetical protein